MSTYHLISWGANSHGQLGQGILSEQCLLPQEIELLDCSLKPENIKKIVGGAGHTLILDVQGHVYSCGWNNKGQTGNTTELENVLAFQRIYGDLKDKTVVNIFCGWDNSAVLTRDGELYLWGSNYYGQLGENPAVLRVITEPYKLSIDEKVKCVSIGLRHTALVTETGNILMSGANSKGQLGILNPETKRPYPALCKFTKVPGLRNIENVACGQHHTIAMTSQRDIYVFGHNKYGQAGCNPQIFTQVSQPTKLLHPEFNSSTQIHAGWTHSNILSDGIIFSWGRGDYGQLGRDKLEKEAPWEIHCIDTISNIIQLSIGSEHNVALDENGTIFCWGWNEHGNCGNGKTKNVLLPEYLPISFDHIGVLVGAGAGHSFAVIKTVN